VERLRSDRRERRSIWARRKGLGDRKASSSEASFAFHLRQPLALSPPSPPLHLSLSLSRLARQLLGARIGTDTPLNEYINRPGGGLDFRVRPRLGHCGPTLRVRPLEAAATGERGNRGTGSGCSHGHVWSGRKTARAVGAAARPRASPDSPPLAPLFMPLAEIAFLRPRGRARGSETAHYTLPGNCGYSINTWGRRASTIPVAAPLSRPPCF
jgi:hypothetical protein